MLNASAVLSARRWLVVAVGQAGDVRRLDRLELRCEIGRKQNIRILQRHRAHAGIQTVGDIWTGIVHVRKIS